jgi:hypothetical protein
VQDGDVAGIGKQIEALIHLLRLSHIRHRFAEPLPFPERRESELIEILRMVHPTITVRDALKCWDSLTARNRPPGTPGVGYRGWQKTGHPLWRLKVQQEMDQEMRELGEGPAPPSTGERDT